MDGSPGAMGLDRRRAPGPPPAMRAGLPVASPAGTSSFSITHADSPRQRRGGPSGRAGARAARARRTRSPTPGAGPGAAPPDEADARGPAGSARPRPLRGGDPLDRTDPPP